ncbi:MAG: (2Fe-2S)-binding protein [Spirochaetes bacterium GWB1_59_5]|nr:MAG: (2Fe-2S)-binding protein [Spirochaetes bacterium GWB1_59_5]
MAKTETYDIRLTVNDRPVSASIAAETTLLDFLREQGFIEVKRGCDKGDCGACTVILEGKAVLSCLTLALQADGCKVYTVKSLGTAENMHPLQKAFVDHEALQCGFCTPGMLLAAKALLDSNPHPTREEIREAISGNLCRCTGYQKIVDAVEAVSKGAYR